MKRSRRSSMASYLCPLAAVLLVLPPMASADVTLPSVIGSHMVLQRDKPLPIWGWAEPGEAVTVTLADGKAAAKADAQGNWRAVLPAMAAGGPHAMTVSGKNTIELTDILVGEVWVCSGQSNMEWGIGAVMNGQKEIAEANYPKIRLFHVIEHRASGLPEPHINATWRVCSPQTISQYGHKGFSAVGYFFGRELHKELDVPVGLIDTSWGGTLVEPWTPLVGFESVPQLQGIARAVQQADREYEQAVPKTVAAIEAWLPGAKKALTEHQRVPAPPAWPVHGMSSHVKPTALYNGMVYAIVPFAVRGAIWYQGESNRGDGMMYFEKMKALINGWRTVWGHPTGGRRIRSPAVRAPQDGFPFLFVQLAPFRYQGDVYALPMIWEAQTAALSIPNTGMAVITDLVDNIADIHPTLKQGVGKRLALWALARTYGRKGLVYSGPLCKAMKVEGNAIRISFDHVGGGLASRDGKPLTHFEIAGADKKFVKAQAKIDGETIVVSSDQVVEPVAVRFGWHQEAMPNLMNKEGLPASPFRTDRW